ncbi:MAG: helix-turn-helix domain-containing protein [Deltaproteobacteria bacterium]|nr:helix-turn-helix domain-containing protein [Deltaproteobacteria bacterium]
MTKRKLMGRAEAATYLGIPARTVYALVRQGEIPAVRVGRVLRFDAAQLDAWRRRRTANAAEPEPATIEAPAVDARLAAERPFAERALVAILAEQREVRRVLVRVANRLAGGAR